MNFKSFIIVNLNPVGIASLVHDQSKKEHEHDQCEEFVGEIKDLSEQLVTIEDLLFERMESYFTTL